MTKVRSTVQHKARPQARALLILLIGLLLAASRASAAPLGWRYSGRLVQPDGAPRSGPVSFEVSLFRSATGGSPLAAKQSFNDVTLKDGIFELPLQFAPADFHALFADEQEVWIELKDLGTGKTLPRQKIEAAPYARKVPVDGSTIAFDSDGRLSVIAIATGQVSGLSSALSSKVETADLTTQLAAKADQATMTTALAGKSDTSHTHALAGDVTGDLAATSVTKLRGAAISTAAPSSVGQVLKWDGSKWYPGPDDGGASGVITNGASLGGGEEIFKDVAAPDLRFRTLTSGSNAALTTVGDTIEIATTPGLTTTAQAGMLLQPHGVAAGNTGEVRFAELAASGSNYVAFKAPDTLAADVTYTLPNAAPAANGDVLSGTTAGTLSWTTPPTAMPPNGSAGGALAGIYPNPTIAANAVTAAEIAANAVDTAELNANAVTNAKIASGAVTTAKLAAAAVTTNELGDNAVATVKIADNAVTSAKIAADSIVAADIAADAVTASEIADSAVTNAKIAADAITSAKIQDGQVQTADLAASAITSNELAANAVTNAKIADSAVATAKIADGAVTNAKLATGIDASKLTGTVPIASIPVMAASGASHAPGFVPDPPATSGTLKLLREDATWAIPSSLAASDGSPTQALVVDAAGNVGIGTTNPGSPLTISKNASSGPAAPADTLLQLVQTNGTSARISLDSYGANPNSTYRRADGTASSPTAVQSGEVLMSLNGFGYGATAFPTASTGEISVISEENFNDTSQASGIRFQTTASGSITKSEKMRITGSGNVGIGTTTPIAMLNVHGGAIVSDTQANAAGVTDINFLTGNVQTSANSTSNAAFKLCGLKDGGSYSLVLTAQPIGSTPTFTVFSDAACSTAITNFDTGGVSLTTSSASTVLTLVRAGNTVYAMWAAGFTH